MIDHGKSPLPTAPAIHQYGDPIQGDSGLICLLDSSDRERERGIYH